MTRRLAAALSLLAIAACGDDAPAQAVDAPLDPDGPGQADAGTPPSSTTACEHTGAGIDYRVGSGQTYGSLGAVPFESLVAGDTRPTLQFILRDRDGKFDESRPHRGIKQRTRVGGTIDGDVSKPIAFRTLLGGLHVDYRRAA